MTNGQVLQNPEEARPEPCPLGVRNRPDLRRFDRATRGRPRVARIVSCRLPAKPSRPIGLPRTEVPGWFSEGWAPPSNRVPTKVETVAPVARVDRPRSIRAFALQAFTRRAAAETMGTHHRAQTRTLVGFRGVAPVFAVGPPACSPTRMAESFLSHGRGRVAA